MEGTVTDPISVTVEEPTTASLLALLMRSLLQDALREDRNRARAAGLRGAVRVGAGAMQVVLCFEDGGVRILPGSSEVTTRARVRGGMADLLGVVTGGALVGPVLLGRIRFSGNPFFLLRMLPLIRRKG